MKNQIFTWLFICALGLFSSGVVLAQPAQPAGDVVISAEKKAFIQEILEISGVKSFRVKMELSGTDVGKVLVRMVDDDKDLTAEQKSELKKSAVEAKDRLEKNMRDYMADTSISDKLFAEVSTQIFDINFTEAELLEIVTFYRTPAGQKAAKFMTGVVNQLSKNYSDTFGKKFREFITARVNAEVEQLNQKIREVKAQKLEA